jgi:hypothetical protein
VAQTKLKEFDPTEFFSEANRVEFQVSKDVSVNAQPSTQSIDV